MENDLNRLHTILDPYRDHITKGGKVHNEGGGFYLAPTLLFSEKDFDIFLKFLGDMLMYRRNENVTWRITICYHIMDSIYIACYLVVKDIG